MEKTFKMNLIINKPVAKKQVNKQIILPHAPFRVVTEQELAERRTKIYQYKL